MRHLKLPNKMPVSDHNEGSRSSSSSDSEDEDEEIGSDEESGMLLHSPSTFNHQLKLIDSTPREPLQ